MPFANSFFWDYAVNKPMGQNWPAATGASTAGRAGSPLPAERVD
ncbi:MAG TPA: hypothetical protein VGH42_10115 [Verrucomicrobiae bacterium]